MRAGCYLIIFRTFILERIKALPTSSVPGVDEKLHGIPSIFVSKCRGTVEPSTAFTLLRSLEVLKAAFGRGVIRKMLRGSRGKRSDGSLKAGEIVFRDMFRLSKEIILCSSSDRDQ